MSIQCTIVPVTPYQQNCSIIKCQASGRGAIVDPGGDVERILEAAGKMGADIEKIILTHAHMDHCAASDVIRQQLGIPIEGPQRADDFWFWHGGCCRDLGQLLFAKEKMHEDADNN